MGAIERVLKIDHPYYLTRDTARAFFALAGYVPLVERQSADGHRGFVLVPCQPSEPDWLPLAKRAGAFLEAIAKAQSNV